MKKILNSPYTFWALLLLPAIPVIAKFALDPSRAEGLLHTTGESSARFMIIAMSLTPLRVIFPRARWLQWLITRRRYLGVAAFAYALLHTLLYIFHKGALQPILDEFLAISMLTGWLAFFIFVPLALTSNNWSQRLLLTRWKSLQRFVYLAAVLTVVHWILTHNTFAGALAHFVPLAVLEGIRIWHGVSKTRRD